MPNPNLHQTLTPTPNPDPNPTRDPHPNPDQVALAGCPSAHWLPRLGRDAGRGGAPVPYFRDGGAAQLRDVAVTRGHAGAPACCRAEGEGKSGTAGGGKRGTDGRGGPRWGGGAGAGAPARSRRAQGLRPSSGPPARCGGWQTSGGPIRWGEGRGGPRWRDGAGPCSERGHPCAHPCGVCAGRDRGGGAPAPMRTNLTLP